MKNIDARNIKCIAKPIDRNKTAFRLIECHKSGKIIPAVSAMKKGAEYLFK